MGPETFNNRGLYHERNNMTKATTELKDTKPKKEDILITETEISKADSTKKATKTEKATPTAKAGKRSSKSVKEEADKTTKELRKATPATDDTPAKVTPVIRTRTTLERRSKAYRAVAGQIDKAKLYPLAEALDLVIKTNPVKFDATVELHVNLGVDPRHADQNIRQTVVLPSGTGKTIKVAVFADSDDIEKAKKAGADIAGGDEFLQQLDKGIIDFDILISTPSMMAKLGKYARILGPKGLMPNPKSGTVTPNVSKAVTEAKTGKIEYRVDTTGIVHIGVGKTSFGVEKLTVNTQAILDSIKASKPASVKGIYFKSAFLTSSMGPSVKLEITV